MKSYPLLNQMFFGIQSFKNPADLDLLKPFFYREAEIDNPVFVPEKPRVEEPREKPRVEEPRAKEPRVEEPRVKEPHKKRSNEWFEPHQKDTLFWCVFVGVFGLSEYLLIHNKYANREWEEKQNMIVAFSNSSSELRKTNHKITLGNIKEMMSEYMTNHSTITLLGLVGLSVHYKTQIYLMDNKKGTHYVYTPETYNQQCFIYRDHTIKGKYRLFLGPAPTTPSFCLDSISRPLRAVSNYKREDLVHIAADLNVSISEKEKKEDIYRKISEYTAWL